MQTIRQIREKWVTGGRPVFMFDFDGTIVDTMGAYGQLAAECMHKHFGTAPVDAKRMYFDTAGIPVSGQLEAIYPTARPLARAACMDEFFARMDEEVYGRAQPFPDIREVVPTIAGAFPTLVSSGNNGAYVRKLLNRLDLARYFHRAMGSGEGSKPEHIRQVREGFRPTAVIFIGDTRHDVGLKPHADVTIGRAGDTRKGMLTKRQLLEAGADYVTTDLRELLKLLPSYK